MITIDSITAPPPTAANLDLLFTPPPNQDHKPLLVIKPLVSVKAGDHFVHNGEICRAVWNHNGQRLAMIFCGSLEALELTYTLVVEASILQEKQP